MSASWMGRWLLATMAPLILAAVLSQPARPALAEVQEIRIVQQFGLAYLPLIIMRNQQLAEQRAAAAGLPALKVTWARVAGGSAANDALLSGSVDYMAVGVGPMLTIWDRTRGNLRVKAVGALDASAAFLNTSNPKANSIADLGDNDRIALPAVKVSHQAVLLQMAAEQAFGAGQYQRLDRLTVTMAHPDATVALLSGRSEITTHFGTSPFMYQQIEDPRIRTLLDSEAILGGPSTVTSLLTTSKFRDENPRVYRVVLEALQEAHALIARDRSEAARIYVEEEKSRLPLEFVTGILNEPKTRYSLAPLNTHKFAEFMHRIGTLKIKPESWKDYYFPEVHDLPGS